MPEAYSLELDLAQKALRGGLQPLVDLGVDRREAGLELARLLLGVGAAVEAVRLAGAP